MLMPLQSHPVARPRGELDSGPKLAARTTSAEEVLRHYEVLLRTSTGTRPREFLSQAKFKAQTSKHIVAANKNALGV
uniref:Uncharacterized protein n=1 Tax=Steinernema glaseri TaxID=37863 RepID=A0A1I7Y753_9BILA